MNEIFIDSNIILYLMDSNDHKRSIAQNLLLNSPFISAQVLTEVANICKRKFNYDKQNIMSLWADLMNDCKLVPTNKGSFTGSIALVKKYNFQLFDSLIVAAALEADCNVLYSEDMHHQLIVEKRLTIINPFI
ncbi:MAG: PIN domain-containing protein [Mucilaginibacter sp.]